MNEEVGMLLQKRVNTSGVGIINIMRRWVWLECIGKVSACCCKKVYRFPHNYYLSLLHLYLIALFCSGIPTSLFILKCFLFFIKAIIH